MKDLLMNYTALLLYIFLVVNSCNAMSFLCPCKDRTKEQRLPLPVDPYRSDQAIEELEAECSLNDLPNDLIFKVTSQFSFYNTDYKNLALVNKRINSLLTRPTTINRLIYPSIKAEFQRIVASLAIGQPIPNAPSDLLFWGRKCIQSRCLTCPQAVELYTLLKYFNNSNADCFYNFFRIGFSRLDNMLFKDKRFTGENLRVDVPQLVFDAAYLITSKISYYPEAELFSRMPNNMPSDLKKALIKFVQSQNNLRAAFGKPDFKSKLQEEIVRNGYPIDFFAPHSLLNDAVSKGYKEEVTELLSQGADPNASDCRGVSALHHAAWFNQVHSLPELLDRKADINKVTKEGETPCFIAAHCGSFNCLQFLILSGADINKPNRQGDTPLMVACLKNKLECASLLLTYGAKIDTINSKGLSALQLTKDDTMKAMLLSKMN